MEERHFSKNWNGGKLDNDYFTIIRLCNPRKHLIGFSYAVFLDGKHINVSALDRIVMTCTLDKIPDVLYKLDTGYDKERAIAMISSMYKNKISNVKDASFSVLLFKRIRKA